MSRRGIHRVTADSESGRRMAQAKGARIATDEGISPDVLEHNRRLDQARGAELAARKPRRKGLTEAEVSGVQGGIQDDRPATIDP